MNTITLNVADGSMTERILWMLEHFKNDGVEISSIEDIEDLKLIAQAKQEKGQNLSLNKVFKEFGVER
ncbi:MAG: hypothetical protein PHV62_09355 [Sulfuricurvum sp.]|nr:hypothetical protein [Sulfuricurvum sp.]